MLYGRELHDLQPRSAADKSTVLLPVYESITLLQLFCAFCERQVHQLRRTVCHRHFKNYLTLRHSNETFSELFYL